MELLDLVKRNYFSLDDTDNSKQICALVNERCIKSNFSETLTEMIEEINFALDSDYIKSMEESLEGREKRAEAALEDINRVRMKLIAVRDRSCSSELTPEVKSKFMEVVRREEQYGCVVRRERVLQLLSCVQSCIVLEDLDLGVEQLTELVVSMVKLSKDSEEEEDLWDSLFIYQSKLQGELIRQVDKTLTDIQWPYISPELLKTSSTLNKDLLESTSEQMTGLFKQLLSIQLPRHSLTDKQQLQHCPSPLIRHGFLARQLRPVPVCVELLIAPLALYFRQFFWTNNKLNQISKPEWYMNQVLQWITVHLAPLTSLFPEPVADACDVKAEFTRGLVLLVMEKMQRDLELAAADDGLFFHVVEEALTMSIDLRQACNYPRDGCTDPCLVEVVCETESHFQHWLRLEMMGARRQLDELFRSSSAWTPVSSLSIRVECLSVFTSLISGMRERLECVGLANGGALTQHRWRLCRVLLEVVADFQVRLVQVRSDALSSEADCARCCDLMNVAHGVCVLLRGWGLHQTFIDLSEYQNEVCSDEKRRSLSLSKETETFSNKVSQSALTHVVSVSPGSMYSQRLQERLQAAAVTISAPSVFQPLLALFQHNLSVWQEACCSTVFLDVVARARTAYTSEEASGQWLRPAPDRMQSEPVAVSSGAAEFLLALRDHLHRLHSNLEPAVFERVWPDLAQRLSRHLLHELILRRRFSDAGARQLDHDIRRCLLALFAPYTRAPDRFFVECVEACTLLTLASGSALLLEAALTEQLNPGGTKRNSSRFSRPDVPVQALLHDVGVYNTEPHIALDILRLRIQATETH